MRLLIVSHSYLPKATPRAFRWGSIAEDWVSRGHEVDVLTAPSPSEADGEVLNGVHVYRQGGYVPAVLRASRQATQSRQERPAASSSSDARDSTKSRKAVIAMVKRIHDLTWKQVRWPDRACVWYLPAVRRAFSLTRERDYDAMITVSHPFTSHLVGLRLKKRRPDLRWIVDVGDPFCFADQMPLNNFLLYRGLNRAVEAAVFRNSDCVAVTNSRTRDRYIDVLGPRVCRNICVIGPAISTSFLDANNRGSFNLPDDQVNVLFVGNLLNPVRRPGELMRWMSEIASRWNAINERRLVFHLVGDAIDALHRIAGESGLDGDNIKCHGPMERSAAIAAIKSADILLNCGNVTDCQLPSKVFEYMATGKPIIHAIFNPLDPSIDALSAYPRVFSCRPSPTPSPALFDFIDEHSMPGTRAQTPPPLPPIVREHLVPRIAEKYEDLLS